MFSNSEIYKTVSQELESGEKLVWSGKPDPVREMSAGFALWLFAIPWTAFALFWMWGASGISRPSSQSTENFIFSLFGLPFVLIGFAMLSAPIWIYSKSKRTVYAITDKRVLIIEKGKSRTVYSYGSQNLGSIKRTERADGSGNLTFAQKPYESDGRTYAVDISFVGIPQVRSVETLLKDTFNR
jgi:hypothetical protein